MKFFQNENLFSNNGRESSKLSTKSTLDRHKSWYRPVTNRFSDFSFFLFFFIEGKSVWNKTNLEWIFLEWRLFHFGFKKVTRRWSDDVWVFQTSLVLSFGHFQSFTFSLDCFYKKNLSNVFHHHMLIISLFWTRIWQTRWNPTFVVAPPSK